MTTIDINSLSHFFLDPPDSPHEISHDEAKILRQASQGSQVLTDLHLKGLQVAKEKAARYGATLHAYPNVTEKPIDYDEKLPRAYQVKDLPDPIRAGDDPIYEDISYLMNLFSRTSILSQIAEAENTCARIGKEFECLTVDDFPCDYYYDGFMDSPSISGGDKKDVDIHHLYSNFPIPDSATDLVTIWAEDTKAIGRYSRMGFQNIHIVYPSDYYVEKRVDERLAWFKKNEANVKVYYEQDVDSVILANMTSKEFMEHYKLPSSSMFFSNYLPQFFHLGDAFLGTMCLYLDEAALDTNTVVGVIPSVSGPYAFKMDYYNHWFHQNYPDIVAAGHGGVYDPSKGKKLSFSVHSCYVDMIYPESLFKGDRLSVSKPISDYTRNSTESSLKVRSNVYWPEGTTFDGVPRETQDGDIVSDLMSGQADSDLSLLGHLGNVIYMPMVELQKYTVNPDSSLVIQGKIYPDFPAGADVFVYHYETDAGSASFKVFDVDWKRKTFFQRRWHIPSTYRAPYSYTPNWEHNYVVYHESTPAVNSFGIDRSVYYAAMLSQVDASAETLVVPEVKVQGVAWNSKLGKFVEDEELSLYIGPSSFVPPTKNTRMYEFGSTKAIRKSLVLQFAATSYFVAPHSDSTSVIESITIQDIIMSRFADPVGSAICTSLYPHTYNGVEYSGECRPLDYEVDIVGYVETHRDRATLTPLDFFLSTHTNFDVYYQDEKCTFRQIQIEDVFPCIDGWFILRPPDRDPFRVSRVFI